MNEHEHGEDDEVQSSQGFRQAFIVACKALHKRFRDALEAGGFDLPESDEGLTQQLELVLVRNSSLIRQAHKRCRASQIRTQSFVLPPVLRSKYRPERAKRNVYGIFPEGLSPKELRFAGMLAVSPEAERWYRNPVRQPESVRPVPLVERRRLFPRLPGGRQGPEVG